MTTADLGTVQVTISGRDVGLGQVMQAASQAMQQAAQGAQILTQNLDRQQAIQERARSTNLAYVSAIVKQRLAADRMSDAFGILTKNAQQFDTATISGARYSALFQTTIQKSQNDIINLALAHAKASVGTDDFNQSIDVLIRSLRDLSVESTTIQRVMQQVGVMQQRNTEILNRRAQQEQQNTQRAAIGALQYAQSQARAISATGNFQQAAYQLNVSLQQLEQQYGGLITTTRQWLNAQTQLERETQRANAGIAAQGNQLFNLVRGLNSYVGAAYALYGIFTNVANIINAGNELERTEAAVRALSKSQERFNEVMDAAVNQQQLYGGTLQQNLEDLSGFIYISNQTGISVDRLADAARRLAIIDPSQGIQGASVALKEFFSGDITSLSRRFEIDRTTLNSIKDLTTAGERLKGLELLLEDMGIGMDVLTERTQLTATTWDRLSGSFGDATASLGQFFAFSMEDTADLFSNVFSSISNGIDNVTGFLRELSERSQQTSIDLAQAAIVSGNGFAQYAASINPVIAQSYMLGIHFEALTEHQINLATEFYRTGMTIEDTTQFMQDYAILINRVGENTQDLENIQVNNITTLEQLQAWLVQNAITYPSLENHIINYTVAMQNNTVTVYDGVTAIQNLINAEIERIRVLAEQAKSIQTAQDKVKELIAANNELISSEVIAEAQSELLSEAKKMVAYYAELAASGLMEASEAALIMSNSFNIAEGDANVLITALKQIRTWQGEVEFRKTLSEQGIAQEKVNELTSLYIELGLDLSEQSKIWQDHAKAKEDAAKAAAEAAEAVAEAAEAQADYEFSLLDTSGKIVALNAKLKGLTKSNKEYWTTLGQIKQLEEQLAKERAGTGGGGGSTATQREQVTELEKLLYELYDIRTEFYSDMEDAEKEYQQNVLDIQKEFARKQKEAEQTNERDKRRSRASFYQSLTDVEGIDVTTFSAQYEQIFLEAQRIAQEGKAALSKEFLDLRQNQLSEMIDLEKEMADVRTDKDLPETTKQAKLEYLQGIKKLLEDAQAEELKQLIEGGDKNQTELADQLAEEAKQYGDQTQKIAQAAKDQADAKITAAERSKKIIGEENQLLQKQLDLYYDIYRLLGRDAANKAVGITTNSVPPALAPGAPTAPAPTEYTVPELKIDTPNVVIQAPQPSAVAPSNATPTAVTSMQALSEVHDRVLTATLQTIGARLESKLAEVITAVYDSAGTTVDAIGKIRLPAPQIVSR